MQKTKTERSNCRFVVQQAGNGKPVLVVQCFQQTIPMLKEVTLGFDLLGGTRTEEAKKLVEVLNEQVLDIFVTTKEEAAEAGAAP